MTRSRLLSSACVAALLGSGVAFAEDGLGYSDIRLDIGLNPTSKWKGGGFFSDGDATLGSVSSPIYGYTTPKQSGDFDSGFHVGALWIGPMCGILPIGCGTSPRTTPSKDIPAGMITDDTILTGDEFNFKKSSFSYDLLMGFGFTINQWDYAGTLAPAASMRDVTSGRRFATDWANSVTRDTRRRLYQDPDEDGVIDNTGDYFAQTGNNFLNSLAQSAGTPTISYTSGMADLYMGWGWEVRTRSTGRWQFEILGFAGLGMAMVDYTDGATGMAETGITGTSFEFGARIGSYYVWPQGFLLGANAGFRNTKTEVTILNNTVDLSTSGLFIGLEAGYRF